MGDLAMAERICYATGRRKRAIARVWIKKGKGRVVINKMPVNKYLLEEAYKIHALEPLYICHIAGKVDVKITVKGGGPSGQAGAIRHGISRALALMNSEFKPILKKADMLTRDPREKERKKYGQRGARAKFQYSKR